MERNLEPVNTLSLVFRIDLRCGPKACLLFAFRIIRYLGELHSSVLLGV